jgi:conjugal transfer pilus assembly protein TraE
MTTYFATLRLNMTPASSNMQRESLLKYTDPNYYNDFKSQLVQEADRINDQHMSIAFFMVNKKADEKHLKVLIEGDLKIYVGEVSLPSKRVSYLIAYRYNSGRLLIKSFEEVKHA